MNKNISLLLLLIVSLVSADLYLHNPRGSNDRNCERNTNRNNGNRLFDSQNNDKGGYACPLPVSDTALPDDQYMYYYEGSKLALEWTSQHGCGSGDTSYCTMILQYMCEDQNPGLRDGTPTTFQDSATNRMDAGSEKNTNFGYHETSAYFTRCSTRNRNGGLYTADQNLGGQASSTRQNPNADRHGWECAEERDYYPYWAPSPWKDIAILSADFGNGVPSCDYFQQHSQNIKSVGECFTANSEATLMNKKQTSKNAAMDSSTPLPYNNEAQCTSKGGYWYNAPPNGGGKPDCNSIAAVRPNSLGNTMTGYMASHVWDVPSVNVPSTSTDVKSGTRCVFRIRYNISTADTPWDLNNNNNYNHDLGNPGLAPNTDPYVQPFPTFQDSSVIGSNVMGAYNLSLSVNTNQYGRTFQDRSYVFFIRSRASKNGAPGGNPKGSGTIWNLNVRGKRGNIVDTFPAVEYDFVPQILSVTQGDQIHIQWTGSDYNPNRTPNAAEGGPQDPANPGNYRADRSNMIQIVNNDPKNNIPANHDTAKSSFFNTNEVRRMTFLNQDLTTSCDDYATLLSNNGNNANQAERDSRNCYKLNAQTSPYFDGGVINAQQLGTFHFMSSRNNNFSNRSQKAIIHVNPKYTSAQIAGIVVGTFSLVGVAGAVGGFAYAKKFPGSRVAGFYNKAFSNPLLSRFV